MNQPNQNNQNNQNKNTGSKNASHQKEGLAHRVGDAIESLGEKIEQKGFKKVGEAVEALGDKIEHMGEKSKSSK